MGNIVGDIFENLGGLASSATKQIGNLPIEIAKTAAGQIKGTQGQTEVQGGSGQKPAPSGKNPSGSRQITSRAASLLSRDQDFAAKRISQIRAAIASQNKQIITSQTEAVHRTGPVGNGPIVPQTRKPTTNNLPVTARQGQGGGEITRGTVG